MCVHQACCGCVQVQIEDLQNKIDVAREKLNMKHGLCTSAKIERTALAQRLGVAASELQNFGTQSVPVDSNVKCAVEYPQRSQNRTHAFISLLDMNATVEV